MPTRWYYRDEPAPITTHTHHADWEDTSILVRKRAATIVNGTTELIFSFTDADLTNKDILFLQLVSELMEPGQTIIEFQTVKAQFMVREAFSVNNMFLTLGMRVINDNGTVNYTMLPPLRDNVEAQHSASIYVNRQFTRGTGAIGDYSTVLGDRMVIEIGMGGTPSATGSHSSDIRVFNGFSSGADLPENDTDRSDTSLYANSWIEIEDTLTFTRWTKIFGKTNLLGKMNVM